MTLESLRTLCAVVDAGSFRMAARQLHRSQPAVSQQVKALERSLGRQLIGRRDCTPTAAGEIVLRRARAVLAAAEALRREIEDFGGAVDRTLRIGASDTTTLYFLPPVIREFAASMPSARVVLSHRDSGAIAEAVARNTLDLGFVTLPAGGADLEEIELFRQRLVLVAPADSPLAARGETALADLAETPCLLLDAATRTGALLRTHFEAAGFRPRVLLDSGSFEVIKRYVGAGAGVGFLPETALGPEDAGLARITVRGLPETVIGIVRRKGAYQGRAERAFLELVRRAGTAG